MKRRIKFYFLVLFANIAKVVLSVNRKVIPASAAILPAATPGSIGDQAILMATLSFLKESGIRHVGLFSLSRQLQWENIGRIDEIIEIEGFFKGKKPLSYAIALWRYAANVARYEKLYCLGNDIMDGFYSDSVTFKRIMLTCLSDRIGVKSSVINFSFNKNPTRDSIRYLRALPATIAFKVRDPGSYERFVKLTGHTAQLTADVAFLLTPEPTSSRIAGVLRWVEEQKSNKRMVIGLNPSLFLKQHGKTSLSLTQFVDLYVNVIKKIYLKNESVSFLLMGHDIRGEHNDFELAKAVGAGISAAASGIKYFNMPVLNAPEMKAAVKAIDIVISGRMHLMILALSQAVPVVCVEYQDKMEGLMELFDINGTIINANDFNIDNFVKLISDAIERREKLHRQIDVKLNGISELARQNFS